MSVVYILGAVAVLSRYSDVIYTSYAARYYRVSVVSLGRALYDIAQSGGLNCCTGTAHCKALSALYENYIHPAHDGMALLGDMLIGTLSTAFRNIDEHRMPIDHMTSNGEIPPPLLGHFPLNVTKCFMQYRDELPHNIPASLLPTWYLPVVGSSGFMFLAYESSPYHLKPGLVSDTVGSVLRVSISTFVRGSCSDGLTHVVVNYLGSYQNRSAVSITCISGCACDPVRFDSTISMQASITLVKEVPIKLGGSKCLLEFKTLKGITGSRFKLIGLSVRARACNVAGLPTVQDE